MTKEAAPVRALIVDDEPLARERIATLLAAEGDVSIVGEAGGGNAAIRLIKSTQPDLVFLDVQMPGCDGFEVLRNVPAIPAVVFVTAYDSHAIKAFEVSAVDYVVKPVAEARFRAAVRRAVGRVRAANTSETESRLAALLEQLAPAIPVRIPIRSDGRVLFVNAHEIDWVDAEDDYVRLHVGKTVYRVRDTMSQMEKRLPGGFVRVHRSAIVNKERVREVHPWVKSDYVLILRDGTRITSGRTYRERVRELIGG